MKIFLQIENILKAHKDELYQNTRLNLYYKTIHQSQANNKKGNNYGKYAY